MGKRWPHRGNAALKVDKLAMVHSAERVALSDSSPGFLWCGRKKQRSKVSGLFSLKGTNCFLVVQETSSSKVLELLDRHQLPSSKKGIS